MNLLHKIIDWINPPPEPFPTYRIEGFNREGYPVWATASTEESTMTLYKALGGDPEKASWV